MHTLQFYFTLFLVFILIHLSALLLSQAVLGHRSLQIDLGCAPRAFDRCGPTSRGLGPEKKISEISDGVELFPQPREGGGCLYSLAQIVISCLHANSICRRQMWL